MWVVFTLAVPFLVLGKRYPEDQYWDITNRIRWLVYKVVDIIRYRSVQHSSVIATGIITNVAVIISVLSAFPWIRK